MLNLEEINNTIEELENADTTFDTCMKLASLYNVREHLEKSIPSVVAHELNDIFPAYHKYIDVKTNYQNGSASDEALQHYLELVCQEIKEFLVALYSTATGTFERHTIEETLLSVYNSITQN